MRTAGPQGDAPREEAATGTAVRLARGGGRRGPAGSWDLQGGSPREEVGEGGAGTVPLSDRAAGLRGRAAGWLAGRENVRAGRTVAPPSRLSPAQAHPLRGARAAGFGV